MTSFQDLALIDPLIKALDKKGYTRPTPIQKDAIPSILEGRDVFGCAQTGTGKTAAFCLPVIQLIAEQRGSKRPAGTPRALILAPTRELALQIAENFDAYASGLPVRHTAIFGGVSQRRQVDQLRRAPEVLIATPGRLLDLIGQGYIHLDQVGHFILDEADKMLDMGFIRDIRKIITKLPRRRQTLFFSATSTGEAMDLARDILHAPVHITVAPVSSATELVDQQVYFVEKTQKRALLQHVLKNDDVDQALVFTRTKHGANRVAKDLNKIGLRAEALHGNKSQNARTKALAGFKDRSVDVLVATDIASRGIDVDDLSHVINFELPEVAETYVHRIGRTGRAGKTGTALSFCDSNERSYLRNIRKIVRQPISEIKDHPYTGTGPVVDNEPADKPPVRKEQPSRNSGQKPGNRSQNGNARRKKKKRGWYGRRKSS